MKKKLSLPKGAKETPEARKKRVSSGVKFRAAVFDDKKKRRLNQTVDDDEDNERKQNPGLHG